MIWKIAEMRLIQKHCSIDALYMLQKIKNVVASVSVMSGFDGNWKFSSLRLKNEEKSLKNSENQQNVVNPSVSIFKGNLKSEVMTD